MSLKLYGAVSSWNTLRARHALLEKGITVEEITLNLSDQLQKVPILALQ
jgi:glutathione S-transferase